MTASKGPILRTEGLKKVFKKRAVVENVSIELACGEIVGLLGPNGAGKTTTFGMVVGLLKPTEGRILFDGADVTRMAMYRRARAGMAYLPQEPSVFRDLTARQNFIAVLEHQKMRKADREKRADQLIEELHIQHVADAKAYTLSGGERRRVEIGRALCINPKVFLLDEPFAGIDPIAVNDLQRTILQIKERGIGVLITDHNVRETLHISDHAYILSEGHVLTAGTPKEIAENPIAREVYLGETFDIRPAPPTH